MSDKYIDLEARINKEVESSIIGELYVCTALEWLDDNPDQVPGRTITQSEFEEALKGSLGNIYRYAAERFLAHPGITVVPDPETTNAEKLVEELKRAIPVTGEPLRWEEVARSLDEAGVKAPGAGWRR